MRVSSSPCVLTLLTMSSCTLKVSTCLWRFLTISSAMYVSWIWFSIFKRFVITYFPLHLCLAFSSVDFLAILVPILSIDFGTQHHMTLVAVLRLIIYMMFMFETVICRTLQATCTLAGLPYFGRVHTCWRVARNQQKGATVHHF